MKHHTMMFLFLYNTKRCLIALICLHVRNSYVCDYIVGYVTTIQFIYFEYFSSSCSKDLNSLKTEMEEELNSLKHTTH